MAGCCVLLTAVHTNRSFDCVQPLLKNGAGFLAAAMAVYLTPILGTPELPFSGTAPKADADDDER